METSAPRGLATVEEAARAAAVSPRTIARMLAAGAIRWHGSAGRVRCARGVRVAEVVGALGAAPRRLRCRPAAKRKAAAVGAATLAGLADAAEGGADADLLAEGIRLALAGVPAFARALAAPESYAAGVSRAALVGVRLAAYRRRARTPIAQGEATLHRLAQLLRAAPLRVVPSVEVDRKTGRVRVVLAPTWDDAIRERLWTGVAIVAESIVSAKTLRVSREVATVEGILSRVALGDKGGIVSARRVRFLRRNPVLQGRPAPLGHETARLRRMCKETAEEVASLHVFAERYGSDAGLARIIADRRARFARLTAELAESVTADRRLRELHTAALVNLRDFCGEAAPGDLARAWRRIRRAVRRAAPPPPPPVEVARRSARARRPPLPTRRVVGLGVVAGVLGVSRQTAARWARG